MTAVFDTFSQPVAQRVTEGLGRINAALKSRSWQEGDRLGLTPTQAEILGLLSRTGKDGLGLTAVASHLQVSRPTASDAVGALERKALIVKEPAPSDRRAITLRLTEAGQAMAIRIQSWPDFLMQAVSLLPEEEQTAMLRALVGTIRALQIKGDIPVQRMCVTCRHFRPNQHPGTALPHHCAFVDAPFGDRHLRIDCPEQAAASDTEQEELWERFVR